jgi:hypothetical protein
MNGIDYRFINYFSPETRRERPLRKIGSGGRIILAVASTHRGVMIWTGSPGSGYDPLTRVSYMPVIS